MTKREIIDMLESFNDDDEIAIMNSLDNPLAAGEVAGIFNIAPADMIGNDSVDESVGLEEHLRIRNATAVIYI